MCVCGGDEVKKNTKEDRWRERTKGTRANDRKVRAVLDKWKAG